MRKARGWTLGTWDAEPRKKAEVGTVTRVLGSTRRAKVALNLRPGSGLKLGK